METVRQRGDLINDFLASIHVLTSAIDEIIARRVQRALGRKLSLTQLKILTMVARSQAGTISNVATFLGVSLPAASKAVDRLVRQGLVKRITSSTDRRSQALSLTAEGKRLIDHYHEVQSQTLSGLFPGVEPAPFAKTTTLIDRLAASLMDWEEAPREVCYRCGIYFRHKCLRRGQRNCSCEALPFHDARRAAGGTNSGSVVCPQFEEE